MATETVWRALGPGVAVVRIWHDEGEGVVFNRASGNLHLLNLLAIEVLGRLQQVDSTVTQLHGRFSSVDFAALEALVASFDELGLIRPASQ